MAIYDQIAKGFNPGQGMVDAGMIRREDQRNKLAQSLAERDIALKEGLYGIKANESRLKQAELMKMNMAKAVAWADTPEKFFQAVQHYKGQGVMIPPEFEQVTPENFPDLRKRAAMMLMSPKEQAERLYPENKPTSLMQNLKEAGYTPGTPEYQQAMDRAISKPLVGIPQPQRILSPKEKKDLGLDPTAPFVWGKDGTPQPIKPTPYSESQFNAASYAERMDTSEPLLDQAVEEGASPESLAYAFGISAPLGNYTMSAADQKYRQAAEDWVRAKLRKESGAVIGDEEMAREIKTYFPIPGDKPGVIEQKKRRRELATKVMARQSGGAYKAKGSEGGEYSGSIDDRLRELGVLP